MAENRRSRPTPSRNSSKMEAVERGLYSSVHGVVLDTIRSLHRWTVLYCTVLHHKQTINNSRDQFAVLE